ncbi:hypothetical protein E4U43_002970 [Claviceps pusilla]|uniref:DUF7704 domain-containing protein n=1 Tax=Claviceps pusilla TaxID=123648 RepID=A0A9P7SVQ9_9HYPO|nr:hypothetical protein E4U43_002970 [Claviceps pusilla]
MPSKINASAVPATTTIPYSYRLILTTIEPILALAGAVLVLANPATYLASMTRHSGSIDKNSAFLYTSLSGSWLYFAFVEAIVLRCFDDQRLWRLLCAGMLLSDGGFCHSAAQAVGGWTIWARVGDWTMEEHMEFWTTAPMVAVRLLIVLGIGFKTAGVENKKS